MTVGLRGTRAPQNATVTPDLFRGPTLRRRWRSRPVGCRNKPGMTKRATGNPLAGNRQSFAASLVSQRQSTAFQPLRQNWHGHCKALRENFVRETEHMANVSLFGVHAAALEVRSQR